MAEKNKLFQVSLLKVILICSVWILPSACSPEPYRLKQKYESADSSLPVAVIQSVNASADPVLSEVLIPESESAADFADTLRNSGLFSAVYYRTAPPSVNEVRIYRIQMQLDTAVADKANWFFSWPIVVYYQWPLQIKRGMVYTSAEISIFRNRNMIKYLKSEKAAPFSIWFYGFLRKQPILDVYKENTEALFSDFAAQLKNTGL